MGLDFTCACRRVAEIVGTRVVIIAHHRFMLTAPSGTAIRGAKVAVVAIVRGLTLVAAIQSFVAGFIQRTRAGPAITSVVDT